ncbi:hypothetical protein [Vannielia litorea]|uniref:hypothetical protein n=1 Tax=Vannielia litorea TaxID=1217970 RepID=UPI001BCC0597|nr:hypothetical protein [Vannielia litorea]MBS8229191.1 hypothetical protein [Vannielia litorea]
MNILKVTVFAAVVSYSSHLPLLASEGADATVNLVIQELIEDVPDIRELLADKENAPESTMVFGSDKTDIQEDLDEQLDRIIKVLVGSDYEAARDELFEIDDELSILTQHRDELRIQSLSAFASPSELGMKDWLLRREFATGSKEDLEEDIAATERNIAALEKAKRDIESAFGNALREKYDLSLSVAQIKSVLYQINGSSIVQAAITFSVLRQIETRMGEILSSTENETIQRRYYAVAAALRLVTMRLHQNHLARYEREWIPKLQDLISENNELISETEEELRDAGSSSRIQSYETNLSVQRRVSEVMMDYSTLLSQRKAVIEKRLIESQKDARLAINTLKTLENAAILSEQFRISDEEFRSMVQIENADLIPLDDEEIFQRYVDISKQMAIN